MTSNIEQTTFLLRYINSKEVRYEVQERFLMFADCSSKRGLRDFSINNGYMRIAHHSSERR